MEGYTIALDFPINDKTLQLMNILIKLFQNMVVEFILLKTVE